MTGRSAESGEAFDRGRLSDLDVAVASPTLLERAREIGVDIRGSGANTRPLTVEQIKELGLSEMHARLRRLAERPVGLMIFGSHAEAAAKGATIWAR